MFAALKLGLGKLVTCFRMQNSSTTVSSLRAASAALLLSLGLASPVTAQIVIAPETLSPLVALASFTAPLKAELPDAAASLDRALEQFSSELKADTQRLSTSALVSALISAPKVVCTHAPCRHVTGS